MSTWEIKVDCLSWRLTWQIHWCISCQHMAHPQHHMQGNQGATFWYKVCKQVLCPPGLSCSLLCTGQPSFFKAYFLWFLSFYFLKWIDLFWGGAVLAIRYFIVLSLVAVSRGCPSWGARASHCGGFSRCRAQALEHVGFGSCSTWA